MRFNKLTEKDKQYIKKKYESGLYSKRSIAAEFGVSATTATSWLKQLGAVKGRDDIILSEEAERIWKLYDEGFSYGEIAKKLCLPRLKVTKILKSLKKIAGTGVKKSTSLKRRFIENPNPPTLLTTILIQHYYDENIHKRRMNHDEAVWDIMLELGRTQEYIEQCVMRN